jgi:hypothetical protein
MTEFPQPAGIPEWTLGWRLQRSPFSTQPDRELLLRALGLALKADADFLGGGRVA